MIFTCPHCRARVGGRGVTECPECRRTMVRHCPFCAEDISIAASICKYCGEAVEPVEEPEPAPAAPPAAPPEIEFVEDRPEPARPEVEFETPVQSVAWEDPARGGRFRRWWSTWASSQLSPTAFWQRMPADRGHGGPIGFSWFQTVQVLLIFLPLVLVGGVCAVADGARPAEVLLAGGAYLAMFPLLYVMTAVATWLVAGLWHLPLKLLGAKGGFETTVRSVSYAGGAKSWALLPVVGWVMAPVMTIVSYYKAFRHAHGMSKLGAAVGVALPLLVAVGVIALALACAPGAEIQAPAIPSPRAVMEF